jgi:hypothetical protein
MIGSIHQPNFLPWLPYFVKMAVGNIHVHLNHVEYSKNGWTNRCSVFLDQKSQKYITLPVVKKDSSLPISRVRISQNWKPVLKKTKTTLSHRWSKREGFKNVLDILESAETFCLETESLCSVNIRLTEQICNFLNIRTETINSSNILNASEKTGEELVKYLCESLGITQYISGTGATNYMSYKSLQEIGFSPIDLNNLQVEKSSSGILDFISLYGNNAPEQFHSICKRYKEMFVR